MRILPSRRLSLVLLGVWLGLTACGAPATSQPAAPRGAGAAQASPAAGPKKLVMAMNQPVEGFTELFGGPASGWRVPYLAMHDFLVVLDDGGDPRPRLATAIPSQSNGTWVVNPDGTMTTTWKLRSGVTWQNGEPLRPADFIFGWNVAKDPSLPYDKKAVATAIDAIDAPDDTTLVLHWQSLYPFADRIQQFDLDPFPSWNESMVDGFANNKSDFVNQPWLTKEFVGLGTYRLGAWDPGVSFEMDAYDGWYGGRPKIDQIEVRNVGDDNTRLAGILAGDIDVTAANSGGPPPSQWETVTQQYVQTGKGQLIREKVGRLTYVTPRWTNPIFGGNERAAIRQAMTYALDRESLAELAVTDRSLVSNSWIQAGTPLYQSQGDKIVVYPYDPARATQMLQAAGWTKGTDGILQNGAGDRFVFDYDTSGGKNVRDAQALKDNWQQVGIDAEISVRPPQLSANLEAQATFPGVQSTGNGISYAFLDGRFNSNQIARPENHYGGQNRAGYSDPRADALLARMLSTIDQQERWGYEGDLAHLVTDGAVFIWLYHPTEATTARTGLTGIVPNRATGQSGDLLVTWNIADWDVAP